MFVHRDKRTSVSTNEENKTELTKEVFTGIASKLPEIVFLGNLWYTVYQPQTIAGWSFFYQFLAKRGQEGEGRCNWAGGEAPEPINAPVSFLFDLGYFFPDQCPILELDKSFMRWGGACKAKAPPCLGFWERKLFFLLSLTRSWKLSGVKATLDSFHFGTSYHIPTNKCRKERIYQSGLMAREAVCHSDYESTKPGRASRSLSGDVSLSDVSQSRMISAAQFSTQRGNWNPFIPPSPSEEKRSLLSLC